MRRIISTTLFGILILAICVNSLSFGGVNSSAAAVDGFAEVKDEKVYSKFTMENNFDDETILIVLSEKATFNFKEYTVKDFPELELESIVDATAESVKLIKNKADPKTHRINIEKFRRILNLKISNKGKENVLEAIKLLEKRDDILSANPNGYGEIQASPNDPEYQSGNQWGLNGMYNINVSSAWDIETGNSNDVTVAVIDTGIDATHPDLSPNIHSASSMHRDFSGSVGGALTDTHGHGTHIAGIIGAKGNNNTGIAGLSWNAKLISLKVTEDRNVDHEKASYAIIHATQKQIDIINFSISFSIEHDTVRQAVENYKGLFVCAAGNNGTNGKNNDLYPSYPTNYGLPNLISVGAYGDDGTTGHKYWLLGWWWYGFNYGQNTVDIYAPGYAIMSTLPGNKYGNKDGTSFATPHVAGVAALIKSKYPSLEARQIRDAILLGTDDIYVDTPSGNDDYWGKKLNALKALQD